MHFDCVFLRNLCEEDAELEETDEGGRLLMVLQVSSTCLIVIAEPLRDSDFIHVFYEAVIFHIILSVECEVIKAANKTNVKCE